MKRFWSVVLLCAMLALPCSVFAQDTRIQTELAVAPNPTAYEQSLTEAVRAGIYGEEVGAVYQIAVLYTKGGMRKTPSGIPLSVDSEECVLSLGERITVTDDQSVLKIYTVAEVQMVQTDENGEESVVFEKRRFELKTLYFSSLSRFYLSRTAAGLVLHLEYGSLSYAYTRDAFLNGQFTLETRDLSLSADENYLTLGTDEAGTSLFYFNGRLGALSCAVGSEERVLSGGEGFFVKPDGTSAPISAPLYEGGEAEHAVFYSASLPYAMLNNSAIADGATRAALAVAAESDVNYVREAYEKVRQKARRDRARTYQAPTQEEHVCPVRVDDMLTGDLLAPLERGSQDSVWTLRYPTSTEAYTVRESGKTINLAALSSERELEIMLTLTVALTDANDVLKLRVGDEEFPVALTEGTDGYVFRVPVENLKKLYAKDASPKEIVVVYQTEATHLFIAQETPAYALVSEEDATAPEADKPYTLTVRLKDALYEEDELYLSFVNAAGEKEKIAPTEVPDKENTFLFTVTPKKGVNFAEVVCASLYELTVQNNLKSGYSALLSATAGEGLVAFGARPVLHLYTADDNEFIPVVVQESADEKHALVADRYGNYQLSEVYADTTLALSAGYSVSLPADNDLYTVEPVAGFSAQYAEAGGEYRFKVHLSHEAALGTSILVKNNGVTLSPDEEGVYIIAEVTQAVRITITHGVTYTVVIPTGSNFAVVPYGGDGTTVLENGTFRFTLQLTEQEAEVSQLIVAANESVITPDSAGIYTVSGIKKDVYITVRFLSSFRVVLPVGDGYVVRPETESDGTVLAGSSYSFTVETDESVHKASEIVVYANETELVPDANGVYTVSEIRSDVYVTVRLRRAFVATLPASTAEYDVFGEAEEIVLYGDSFSFNVLPKGKNSITVLINGRAAEGVSGTYKVSYVSQDIHVTVLVNTAAPSRHRITLSATEGLDLLALSATEVQDGGKFAFALSAAGISSAEELTVEVSAGTLEMVKSVTTQDGLLLLYTVSGVDAACTVTAAHAATEG